MSYSKEEIESFKKADCFHKRPLVQTRTKVIRFCFICGEVVREGDICQDCTNEFPVVSQDNKRSFNQGHDKKK